MDSPGFVASLLLLCAILDARAREIPDPSSTTAISVENVRELIDAHGARGAIHTLFQDDTQWEVLLEAIGTGREEWLLIASELRPASDAHASETLDMAIQEALPHNPVGVLRRVNAKNFSIHGTCGGYGFGQIEDERPMSTILRLVDERITAISDVKEPDVLDARRSCLQELRVLREVLETNGRTGQ